MSKPLAKYQKNNTRSLSLSVDIIVMSINHINNNAAVIENYNCRLFINLIDTT